MNNSTIIKKEKSRKTNAQKIINKLEQNIKNFNNQSVNNSHIGAGGVTVSNKVKINIGNSKSNEREGT
jgi:hypothetical protein